jgi:hypothetical protein
MASKRFSGFGPVFHRLQDSAMCDSVAGLLPKDELDMIINDIRPVMKQAAPGIPDTWDNLYSFFLNRVRDNLHVCLCFSPVGAKFSRRAMQFPGLINGCTIDWFLPWPEEALTSGNGAGCRDCLHCTSSKCLSHHGSAASRCILSSGLNEKKLLIDDPSL